MDDPVSQIRLNCYETMLNIAEFQEGIDQILNTDILFLLVDKLIEEKDMTILKKVLVLIKCLLYGENGTYKALSTSVITRLNGLLDSKDDEVKDILRGDFLNIIRILNFVAFFLNILFGEG